MVEFHKLSANATKQCPRNEDLIKGRIPDSDKQFLRMMETTSLSKLAEDVRGLAMSVGELTKLNKYVIAGIIAIFVAVVGNIIKSMVK